ncbi:MAG: hypothetical protein U0X39_06925 [Bacteroidales bacterium]
MKRIILPVLLLVSMFATAQNRWKIQTDGSITWSIKKDVPHFDHIEMSGEQVSVVLRYGVRIDSSFSLERSIVWPMLRTIPNNTHASLNLRSAADFSSLLAVNGATLRNEKVRYITLDGILKVVSDFRTPVPVTLTRLVFPSTTLAAVCEKYTLKNNSPKPVTLLVPDQKTIYRTDPARGVEGSYTFETSIQNTGYFRVSPGEEISFTVSLQAYSQSRKAQQINVESELTSRQTFVKQMWNDLVLETPDTAINRMFAFAKIRGSESIYRTSGGLMHGPGGEAYYAAIWANDQAEYIGPFFPYLGYRTGNEASLNAYMHFARFINKDYKPIPSSIIAEGKDIWDGAGDRGDAAMIAYGASRYALARGDKAEAEKLWPLISWCLEYCNKKLNKEGVVTSDSDELEGRFPSGDANLCTSTLYYDALLSSAYLAQDLGKPSSLVSDYRKKAAGLKKAINTYFGANIKGFDTYQYYKGCTLLRSWICMPLVVGINERTKATIDALFSPALWTKDGLLTQEGSTTFWDRSTLYALRGVYNSGETSRATDYLKYYSETRLLGEHVPYAIEAWPEGSQRHLSAESGLYCRILTEGLFGIRPTGLASCTLTPHLPDSWNSMSLNRIHAFGTVFNISVKRQSGKTNMVVSLADGKIIYNNMVTPNLPVNIKFQ